MNSAEMSKVVVIGAGLMGAGIAHAFVSSGFRTALVDINSESLKRAHNDISTILGVGVKIGKISQRAADAALDNLTIEGNISVGAAGANWVIETVSENIEAKRKVVLEAVEVMADDGIIATNTSALSVTEIARSLPDPERFAGMHFFNPVHKMKLVELVRGLASSDDTISRLKDLCASIGKKTVVVNESPGLTTSRMSALLGNEAMYMLQEGTASAEDIDTALRMGFNHPMGPLELGDLTGWDTRLSVLRYLHATLGEKFRPCPLIIKMVAAGHLGKKVGHGVYKYEDGKLVLGSGLKVNV